MTTTAATSEQVIIARAQFESTLGEVLLLLSEHPLYEQLFLEELDDRIIPPLVHHQYKFLHDANGNTIGYITWATLDESSSNHFLLGGKIQQEHWQSGEKAIVVDVITPSIETNQQLINKVKTECFADQELRKIIFDAVSEKAMLELV